MSARQPLVLPAEPQEGWRIAKARPEHAKAFRGSAKCIPENKVFWLWYQHRWIHDRSLMRLFPKSRRIGISYGTAYECVRSRSLSSCQADAWVSSRDEVSALEFIRYCTTFAKALDLGARDLGHQVLFSGKDGAVKTKAHVLDFASGRRICSLSGNPDAMASKGGDVELDEFALRKDPKQAYAIAEPTITWGGRLAIISSMRPGYFAQLCREVEEKGNPKGWSYHKATLEDALNQGFLWKIQCGLSDGDPRLDWDEQKFFDSKKDGAADIEFFNQEYMCVPMDESAAFITQAMIEACQYPREESESWEWSLEEAERQNRNGAALYGGLDIGRHKDFTWFTLAEKVGGRLFVRKMIRMRKAPFHEQEAELYPWFKVCRRLCGDKNGLGEQFMERAQRTIGQYRVEPVQFTQGTKEDMAYPVRSAMEERNILIPEDALLASHLRAIRKEVTKSGNIRFAADSTADGHADGFWSLALVIHAVGNPSAGAFTSMDDVLAVGSGGESDSFINMPFIDSFAA